MRIHLPLQSHQFKTAPSDASSPLLVQLGGDLVLVELQGELSWEGDRSNGVVGVIGLDRPDKPTLHLGPHHLLHGKFSNLQKPYAVIRRVIENPGTNRAADADGEAEKGIAVEGDANEEDESSEEGEEEGEDEEEEPPLFPEVAGKTTPIKAHTSSGPRSSSPVYPPSTPQDYSSDIEMSSPARSQVDGFGLPKRGWADDEEGEEGGEDRRKRKKLEDAKNKAKKEKKEKRKREKGERERTRHYAVVAIVRKKVVFALRPEPLVAPTILPE